METHFLPAKRSQEKFLQKDTRTILDALNNTDILKALVDFVSDLLLVLNQNRQIVFANQAMLDFVGADDLTSITGMRPGEVFQCVNADKSEGGCGTSPFCRVCGAAKCIHQGMAMAPGDTGYHEEECRVIRKKDMDVMDILVRSRQILISERQFILVSLADTSHEKRRRALERIFFHDVLNLAGNIQGFSEILRMDYPTLNLENPFFNKLQKCIRILIREIQTQKDIAAAENNDLSVHPVKLNSLALVHDIKDLYADDTEKEKRLFIDGQSSGVDFVSDRTLLIRVLGNMVKNALEATLPKEPVTLGCGLDDKYVEFWVHNPTVIPEDVQMQIFQRSFSTKSKDRGLGTYSMKLLNERYLNGSVHFVSTPERGTVFTARYPYHLIP